MNEVPWPKYFVYHWRCRLCTAEHTSRLYSPKPGETDWTSFSFQCPCGAYYSKRSFIPDSAIIKVTEERAE